MKRKLDGAICGKFFASMQMLKKHIKEMHVEVDDEGQGMLECDKCDAKFHGKNSLKQHQQDKHPETPGIF